MSERPDDIPEATVPTPRESAVVILARRRAGGGWELLMGLRSRKSRFFPGNWAFPGGGLEADDRPGHRNAHARCAARELREETGIEVDPARLTSIGIKTTPPFHPVRYRTEFFVTEVPASLEVPHTLPAPDETEALRFVDAAEAIEEWEAGRMLFPPPLPPLLRVFARERRARFDQLPRLLAIVNEYEERVPRIEFTPGIWMFPVTSPTLPPATHTNAWIVGGRQVVLVDPGTDERFDLDHLALVLERRLRIGASLAAIVLTHHHRDHVAGAAALAARFGVPVRAHPATADVLHARGSSLAVEPDLEDGTRLDLGGMTLVAHHTPGHAAGHLLLEVPERRVALIGDLLSGFSTIVIHPDEGDMGQYVDSLRRARELDVALLLPGHGPPLQPRALDRAIAHREERGQRVLDAVTAGPPDLPSIAAAAYADTPGAPPRLAALQTRAHLLDLERRGLVRRLDDAGDGWA